jgi:hypothetical protein
MSITNRDIDQAFSDLKGRIPCALREDFFGMLYLEREFKVSRNLAIAQVAFGGHDYGIDGFHLDPDRRNLYLFQFKWSTSYASFKGSFQRLIDDGMKFVFGCEAQDQRVNPVLEQLKSRLLNDQALIDRVFVHFVFNGDPEDAERSTALDALRENLESKRHFLDQFFRRPVSLVIEFRSAKTVQVAGVTHQRRTYRYRIPVQDSLRREGPNGERMHVGFIRLADLHRMYCDMRQRFFERNIRAGLSDDAAPNRAIRKSLKEIVLDQTVPPSVFAFNHNGVTLFAERFERVDDGYEIAEPRLLNGAQTVTTFDGFLASNEGNQRLAEARSLLDELWVMCKIITGATPQFIVAVTINNNRQNPVMPWNLRANDMIQLELQDKFRDDLGIYYERQEMMFAKLSDEDLEELEITHHKAVELLRLAKTFLASDGFVDKMSNMTQVFEGDTVYDQVFCEPRLKADCRKILLCYKIQFRLRKLVQAIVAMGERKYAFMERARNLLWALLCQAVLNDDKLDKCAEEFGESLVVEANFTDWIAQLAPTRARPLIASIVKVEPYAENAKNENYGFLRTQAVFNKCMKLGYDKWHWVHKRLR